MFPLSYGSVYQPPVDYQPPEETNLSSDTDYPNLNSRDYAKRAPNRSLRMHTAWECISMNDAGHIVIGTNKLSGREWTGSLWGFENIEEISLETANFKLQCRALISRLMFTTRNIILLALYNGKLQTWSTYSEVRNPENPYCLFMIGEKNEHVCPIISMDYMKANKNIIITGSKEGTLKVWDMEGADLCSIHTFRFAHADSITGVCSSTNDESILASCSLDKSVLLWDVRLARPAIAIYEKHNARLKDIVWANKDTNENLIYFGDEIGYIHSVDTRQPNKFYSSLLCYDRPIRKISPNGNNLAIIADSNFVKITTNKLDEIQYENGDAKDFVRDCVWRNDDELLTVGYEGKIRVHKIL